VTFRTLTPVSTRPAAHRGPTSGAAARQTPSADDLSDWGESAAPARAPITERTVPVVAPNRATEPRRRTEAAPAPARRTEKAAAPARRTASRKPSTGGPKLRRRVKPRVRRVTRVIRRVDAWSVLKIALGFAVTICAVFLVAGAILWSVMQQTGTLDNFESFVQQLFALDSFSLNGSQIFQAYAIVSAVLTLVWLGVVVAGAVFFNLLADLTGGIRVTVLEEEVLRVDPRQLERD
jgi:Transmembrane domain of unknown function (DUF3566)